ncbi:MAG: DoxX family protein [Actinomycetota bacterium]|nr:DoxX family protein [Actinomycetota bacterium]
MAHIKKLHYYEEPRIARWLFASRPAAVIWLIARVYLGYEWLKAGWDKVFGPGSAAWMKSGVAVKGFSQFAATQLTKGDHPAVAYGWYKWFLNLIANGQYHWVAKVVAVGELALGIMLILGIFTGVAALFGATLNFSYVFAGSAGVNPLFILISIALILAWRVAGYYGADRYLLPLLGTPDEPGKLFNRTRTRGPVTAAA